MTNLLRCHRIRAYILTILSIVLNVPLFVTTPMIYETKSTFLVFSSQRSFDR